MAVVGLLLIAGGSAAAFASGHNSKKASARTTGPSKDCAGCNGSGSSPGAAGGSSSTPEQTFANDVQTNLPVDYRHLGTESVGAYLGAFADDTCNQFQRAEGTTAVTGLYANLVSSLVNGLYQGAGARFAPMGGGTAKRAISFAIEDVCPNYESDIPYGNPGAGLSTPAATTPQEGVDGSTRGQSIRCWAVDRSTPAGVPTG